MQEKEEVFSLFLEYYLDCYNRNVKFTRTGILKYTDVFSSEAEIVSIVSKFFGSFAELKGLVELRVQADDMIAPTRDDLDSNKKYLKNNKSKNKKFIITAAMPEAELHRPAWEAIQNYAEQNKAEIIVLAMRGMHHSHKRYTDELYSLTKGSFAVEHSINDNLLARDIKLYPAHRNPAYGNRDLAKNKSLIIAHTKQDQAPCQVFDPEMPRSIYTTGVITQREFNETLSGFRNQQELILGGLVVDVDHKSGDFWARHIQFQEDGSFANMGKIYSADGSVKEDPGVYLKMGDVHSLFTEPQYKNASIEMINHFNVKEAGAGDWFDGKSISHYEANNMIEKSKLISLEYELNYLLEDVKDWCDRTKCTLGMTASNHPEWIDRYLVSNRWTTDVLNYKVALQLMNAVIEGNDPIEWYFKKNAPEIFDRLKFYKRNDFLRLPGDWLYTAHGDLGPDGARGSIHNQQAAGNLLMEHIHGPGKRNSIMAVGTLALKTLQYASNRLTSWQAQNIIVFESGTAQQLWMNKDGRWGLE